MARGDACSSGGAASSSSRSALFGSAGGVLAQRRGDVEDRDIEAELDGLFDRVARLRRVVGDIDEETRNQRTLVESLEATVLQAQAALRETLRKMNRTYNSGGGGCVRACRDARRAGQRAGTREP